MDRLVPFLRRAHTPKMRRFAEPRADDVRRRLEPPDGRVCEHPDCEIDALHAAPRSQDALGAYCWFCLDHVRDYNKSWDFFDGMNAAEIEAWRREDVVGHRPTWRIGETRANTMNSRHPPEEDFGLFDDERAWAASRRSHAQARVDELPVEAIRALETLDLLWPVDWETIRRQYRALAKKLHPDANGGEQTAEERLKSVNQAYALLKSVLGEGRDVAL